jgi:drug/metabolite transporter (DMT)-like permease
VSAAAPAQARAPSGGAPFQLYLRAVALLAPERAASFLSLIPLTGVVAAATVLGEPVTYRAGVGAAVVVLSLYLLSISS